jgi:hypothetical protein
MLTDTIKASLADTLESTGSNLRGFEFDLSYWLDSLSIFTAIRTRRTGDRLCLLTAECTLPRSESGLVEATRAVASVARSARIWVFLRLRSHEPTRQCGNHFRDQYRQGSGRTLRNGSDSNPFSVTATHVLELVCFPCIVTRPSPNEWSNRSARSRLGDSFGSGPVEFLVD